jgi:hypothetical protein
MNESLRVENQKKQSTLRSYSKVFLTVVAIIASIFVILLIAFFIGMEDRFFSHSACKKIEQSSIKGAKSYCGGFEDEAHLVRFKGTREDFGEIIRGMNKTGSRSFPSSGPGWWKIKDSSKCESYERNDGNWFEEATFDPKTGYIYLSEWDY